MSFLATNLRAAKGLDALWQNPPSSIGMTHFYESSGEIPKVFLCGTGEPEELISHLLSFIGAIKPIQWHGYFIGYSNKGEEFAKRLYSRMRQDGQRVLVRARRHERRPMF